MEEVIVGFKGYVLTCFASLCPCEREAGKISDRAD